MSSETPIIFSPAMDGDDTEIDAVRVFLNHFAKRSGVVEDEHLVLEELDVELFPDDVGNAWWWTLSGDAPDVSFDSVPAGSVPGMVAWLLSCESYGVVVCSEPDKELLEELASMHALDEL